MRPESFFAALGHDVRLRLLLLLQQEGELCVCELTYAVDVVQPTVSRYLAEMRRAGLVTGRRQGQWIYYRLHPELPQWAQQVLADTLAGVGDQAPYARDRSALAGMSERPGKLCCG